MKNPERILSSPRTTMQCPGCMNARPLHEFRRWAGSKRMLHEVCNVCIPDKRLSEMTPAERLDALDTDNLSVRGLRKTVVEQMNAKELHLRRSKLRSSALKRHGHERRVNWAQALFTKINKELDWVRRTGTSQRALNSPQWQAFLEAYRAVLKEFNRLALIRAKRPAAPLKPTMEDTDPATYIRPETVTKLHALFSACADTVKGTRLKDPWFLEWKKEKPNEPH